MSLTLSTAARNACANAVADLADAGAGVGKIRIYNGTRPAGPGTAISTQTLLVEIPLADPAFEAVSGGTRPLDATPVLTADAVAAGTAVWFRVLDSNNVAIIDGKATAEGGGGDLELNTVTISVGLTVEITSGGITMPAGTAD